MIRTKRTTNNTNNKNLKAQVEEAGDGDAPGKNSQKNTIALDGKASADGEGGISKLPNPEMIEEKENIVILV